jgi:hypothetical protein
VAVARWEVRRELHKGFFFLVGKPVRINHLDVRIILKWRYAGSGRNLNVVQARAKWQAVVKAVMNLRVS